MPHHTARNSEDLGDISADIHGIAIPDYEGGGARQGGDRSRGRVRYQAGPERVPAPGAELASRAVVAAAAKAKNGGHFRETRVLRRPIVGPRPSARGSCRRLWRRGTSQLFPAVGAKTVARHERTLPIKPPEAALRGAPPTEATLRAARRRNSNAPCAGDEELCVDFCAAARARTLRARALWSASQLRSNVPTSSDARVPLKWTKLRRRLPLPCVVCARTSPRPSGGDVVRPVRLLVVFAARAPPGGPQARKGLKRAAFDEPLEKTAREPRAPRNSHTRKPPRRLGVEDRAGPCFMGVRQTEKADTADSNGEYMVRQWKKESALGRSRLRPPRPLGHRAAVASRTERALSR
ncbi:hypothetical protein HPB50_006688 [Hyalomma asiaticum]|uniref:Uncharacterized protein n=1 Tax=Hyalomma asiaticum TaxID=266040 RepID=A0ACB7TCV5_HYAAI|nr:hypothetical protein HPB50_006688 [Hyalomma asiaticum]